MSKGLDSKKASGKRPVKTLLKKRAAKHARSAGSVSQRTDFAHRGVCMLRP